MGNLTSKGQVSIPKELRDRLGLQAGDAVEFRVVDGQVVAAAVESRRAWDAGHALFGRHASGQPDRSTERKRLLREKRLRRLSVCARSSPTR